jgi:DNA (cytosine-5)-methyltransferase 1
VKYHRTHKVKFIDLFAGIGGTRLALEQAGATCVYSVEIDRFAIKTYEANHGHVDAQDIRLVTAEHLPSYDVLVAGFPCQPFSIAGVSKKKSLGKAHGFLEETSGTMFFEIARLTAATKPAALLLENVKNLNTHDSGNTMSTIVATLTKLGYQVKSQVIDGKLWVPQHRERTYIVALRNDLAKRKEFEFPKLPEKSPTVLGDILEEREDFSKYILSPKLWSYLRAYAAKHRAAGNGFGFGLVGPEATTRTLSARYYKDGSEILVDRGSRKRPRRLTPRECARLMGFPDSFLIVCSDTAAYKQFGNSVVVPAVKHIARPLIKLLREHA